MLKNIWKRTVRGREERKKRKRKRKRNGVWVAVDEGKANPRVHCTAFSDPSVEVVRDVFGFTAQIYIYIYIYIII